jgi:hypothetical protein
LNVDEDIYESGKSCVGIGFQLLQSKFWYPRSLELRSYISRNGTHRSTSALTRFVQFTILIG